MTLNKRAAMIFIAALAIPLAVFAAPLPAHAVTGHLCETSGSYCVGAPGLSLYASVVETADGRELQRIDLGSGQVKLEFAAAPGWCVAGANDGVRVDIKECNGQNGSVWIESRPNGHYQYESREFPGLYLCGLDDGGPFELLGLGPGHFCRFDWR